MSTGRRQFLFASLSTSLVPLAGLASASPLLSSGGNSADQPFVNCFVSASIAQHAHVRQCRAEIAVGAHHHRCNVHDVSALLQQPLSLIAELNARRGAQCVALLDDRDAVYFDLAIRDLGSRIKWQERVGTGGREAAEGIDLASRIFGTLTSGGLPASVMRQDMARDGFTAMLVQI